MSVALHIYLYLYPYIYIISRPIAEYANLHTKAFVDQQLYPLPAANGAKNATFCNAIYI
jgi:hypothetical protein